MTKVKEEDSFAGFLVQEAPKVPVRSLTGGFADIPYEHPYDIRFKPFGGWNKNVTLLDDPRLFRRFPQFRLWTKVDHLREARFAQATANALHTAYSQLVGQALESYGSHGPLVSGIVRGHFPEEVKDTLRWLAHRTTRERDRALTHWKAAGKRKRLF